MKILELSSAKWSQGSMRELAIAFSNSPDQQPRAVAEDSVRDGRRRPEELRDEERARGGGEGETSAVFSQRLCAFTPSSLLVCSSRPQRGDAPHASQVTSSPRAPQIAVLNTRRRIGGTAVVSFSFLFSFSLSPSFLRALSGRDRLDIRI